MEIVSHTVEALKTGLKDDLLAVALFGSRARGEDRPGSDWDLFVLVEHLPPNPLDRQFYLREMLPLRWATKVSLLAKTPTEFEAELLAVYLDLAADAVILFDPRDYLKTKLQDVREIAHEVGLRRRRWKGQWTWDWEKPPHGAWEVNWR